MGKKMKLPFLSKINDNTHSSSSSSRPSWPWPVAYCQQPRTLSFRAGDTMFKTINSAYNVDAAAAAAAAALVEVVDTPDESWFTNSSESASFSTASDESAGGESIENVIRGLRSERLFFEPGETSSILEEAKANGLLLPFIKESTVVLSMESQDPYVDFKKSMEEMVEAHGLSNWEGLEELLCCYLKVNGKSNHGYIIGAFVDLLVGLSSASNSTRSADSCSHSHSQCSPSSPLSFYTSSSSDDSSSTLCCVSSLEDVISTNTPCSSSLEDKEIETIREN